MRRASLSKKPSEITRQEDKARAAGRAFRRAMNKLKGDR
jgi:hypothetical protein